MLDPSGLRIHDDPPLEEMGALFGDVICALRLKTATCPPSVVHTKLLLPFGVENKDQSLRLLHYIRESHNSQSGAWISAVEQKSAGYKSEPWNEHRGSDHGGSGGRTV